jgi:hypothetical protein
MGCWLRELWHLARVIVTGDDSFLYTDADRCQYISQRTDDGTFAIAVCQTPGHGGHWARC